jgi:hypothetical protein
LDKPSVSPGQYFGRLLLEDMIRRLTPMIVGDTENPWYRVKSIGGNHERGVFESEISLSRRLGPVVS